MLTITAVTASAVYLDATDGLERLSRALKKSFSSSSGKGKTFAVILTPLLILIIFTEHLGYGFKIINYKGICLLNLINLKKIASKYVPASGFLHVQHVRSTCEDSCFVVFLFFVGAD